MRSQFFTFLYINVCSWRSAEGAAPLPAPRNRAGQARGGRARRRGRPSRCLPLSPPPPGPARPGQAEPSRRPRPPLAPLGPSPPAERRRAGRRLPPPSRRGSYTGSRPGSPPSPGSSAPPPAPRRGPAGPARPFAVTLLGARPTRPGPPRKAAGGPGLLWGGGVGRPCLVGGDAFCMNLMINFRLIVVYVVPKTISPSPPLCAVVSPLTQSCDNT